MPYKSLKQERYFNANKSKLQKQGVNVNEWNKASKGLQLPKTVKPKGRTKTKMPTMKQAKTMPLNKLGSMMGGY